MSQTTTTPDGALPKEIVEPIQVAKRLLAALRIDVIEDMEDFAWRLGFPVEYSEDVDASGASGIRHSGQRFIVVNARTHRVHQQFTIAHEIGHHVLGHPVMVLRQDTLLEFEANLFASTLFLHYDGAVSIASHQEYNPDVAPMMFAPLVCDHLPDIISCVIAFKEIRDQIGRACEGISRTLLRIAQFLVLFRKPEV